MRSFKGDSNVVPMNVNQVAADELCDASSSVNGNEDDNEDEQKSDYVDENFEEDETDELWGLQL